MRPEDYTPAFSKAQIDRYVEDVSLGLRLSRPHAEIDFVTRTPTLWHQLPARERRGKESRFLEGQTGVIQINDSDKPSVVTDKFVCTTASLPEHSFWRPCDDHSLGVTAEETYRAFARLGLRPC